MIQLARLFAVSVLLLLVFLFIILSAGVMSNYDKCKALVAQIGPAAGWIENEHRGGQCFVAVNGYYVPVDFNYEVRRIP